MFEVLGYIIATQQAHAQAREALPDAPVQPVPEPTRRQRAQYLARQQASATLRRLADRLEPPAECPPMTPVRRT